MGRLSSSSRYLKIVGVTCHLVFFLKTTQAWLVLLPSHCVLFQAGFWKDGETMQLTRLPSF